MNYSVSKHICTMWQLEGGLSHFAGCWHNPWHRQPGGGEFILAEGHRVCFPQAGRARKEPAEESSSSCCLAVEKEGAVETEAWLQAQGTTPPPGPPSPRPHLPTTGRLWPDRGTLRMLCLWGHAACRGCCHLNRRKFKCQSICELL